MLQLKVNVSNPGKSTEKTTTQFLFFLPLLLFKFKFTSFIKNMPNMVKNVKRNNDLVQKLKLPSAFKQVRLKIYNGLNKQKLLKTLE